MSSQTGNSGEEIGGWERWHDWQAQQQAPVIDWYLRATRARPGLMILDVASGTGIPALALAERVGPTGKVVTADISAKMLGAIRRKAAASDLANVETCETDAAAIGGRDGAFDVVTCKDGLMFCSDIVATLREFARVLAPRGRYAMSVWAEPELNPLFARMFGVLAPYLPGPPPGPDAPGPFRLSAPGELERVLHAAGFTELAVERVSFTWHWDSPAQHFDCMSVLAGPLERVVASLRSEDRTRLQRAFADAYAPFTSPAGIDVPGLQLCVSGQR